MTDGAHGVRMCFLVPSWRSQNKWLQLFRLPIDVVFLVLRARNFECVIGVRPIGMQACIAQNTSYHDRFLILRKRHVLQLPYLGRISDFPRFPRRCRRHCVILSRSNDTVSPILVGFYCQVTLTGRRNYILVRRLSLCH